jgi:hypothetical protein
MNDIIEMAREAGCSEPAHPMNDLRVSQEAIERFAALVAAAERNKLVAWMMAQGYTCDTERDKVAEWMGYTTGQGDATKDLLAELGWQIEQRIKGLMSDMSCQVLDRVKAEREAILQMSAATWFKTQADYDAAIRARGQDPMPLFDDWNKDWK